MRVIKTSDELRLPLIENLYGFSVCNHQIPQHLEDLPLHKWFCFPKVFVDFSRCTCMKVSR